MSNRKKDGDFNLDEELRNNIIASEDGQILSDDHEDIIEPDGNLEVDPLLVQKKANQKKYGIHPSLKCRDELIGGKIAMHMTLTEELIPQQEIAEEVQEEKN